MLLIWLSALCAGLGAQGTGKDSYLEFGTVVALGRRTVDVQTQDPRVGRAVQRSFTLSRETQADLVHVGDNVEVIYSAGRSGEWMLERLIALHGEVPKVGPAPNRPALPAVAEPSTPAASVAAVPKRSRSTLGRSAAARASKNTTGAGGVARTPAPAVSPVVAGPAAPVRPVSLGVVAPSAVPPVSRVGLGGAPGMVNPAAPRAIAVMQQPVGELCNRTQGWAAQPVTLAVLDFRYPTEREEARDLAQVGGGSGTALGDQVYNRLSADPKLVLSRGDRDKLFRMDFAGAARLGRQLGVDAVLLGTFVPVEQPVPDPEFPPATQAYTMRAGIVETCTGELLYKLTSSTCGEASAGTCPGASVTAKQASNPEGNTTAFAEPLRHLLAPMLDDGTPAGVSGDAGTVTEVRGANVTLRITSGAGLRPGDQVGVHAFRLAKIPSTNTVHVFRNELIGRVTLERVSGQYAYGTFAGEPAPLPGDTADLITR